MTTEPVAIPAETVEAIQEAAIEFGLMLTDEHATALAKAMADRASRAPVDGAGAKPVAWVQQKTLDALVEMSKGASSFQIANARFAAWDVPLYTHPAPASPDAEMVRELESRAENLTKKLSDPAFRPTRAHIESCRNLVLRAAFALSKHGGDRVHQHVMDFWPELSATDLPEPSPKPAGGEWVTVPREPTREMVWAFWNASGPDAERYRAMISAAPAISPADGASATHRHKKRGTEYVLIGYGKMQTGWWIERDSAGSVESVDMREVAIYRRIADSSLWVRPREEFEDGRFEPLTVISPEAPQASEVVRSVNAIENLRRQIEAAHPNHKTMFVYVDDLRAALAKIGGDHDK